MAKHSWNTIHSLAGKLGFTSDETESLHEIFKNQQREICEFSDIAKRLSDLMKATGPDSFDCFDPESGQYKERCRLALLFIVLLDWEGYELSLQRETEDFSGETVREFAEKYRPLFDSGIFSVFVLEAASAFFTDWMNKEKGSQGEKQEEESTGRLPESYVWLRRIFREAQLYNKLLTYYKQDIRTKGAGADPFFLKLLLIYSGMAPADPDYYYSSDLKRVFTDILTGSGRSGKEEGQTPSKAGLVYSRYMDEGILSVLGKYAGFVPEPDLRNLTDCIRDALSERPGSMAAGSLDILLGLLAEKEGVPRPCLRMRYIDAVLLKKLCEKIAKNTEADPENKTEFEIAVPEWGRGETAFVTRKYRRLIRLDADSEGVKIAFRGLSKLERRADDWDWDDRFLSGAGRFCRRVLRKPAEGSSFLFSFVYLRNYRSIGEFQVSFDHRYRYDPEDRTIKTDKKELSSPYFYGSHVYSLTCLVGRNGAGKSSLVDFLRETFLTIIMDAEEKELRWKDGRPVLSDADLERYGLISRGREDFEKHTAEFLVIFKVGEKDLYLTNIGRENISFDEEVERELLPYTPVTEEGLSASERGDAFVNGNDLTLDDCTLAYFSQFHYPTGMYSATHISEGKKYKERIDRYVRDLSEENFDRRTGNDIDEKLNESLLHQIIFLLMRAPGARNQKGLPAAEDCARYDDLEVISDRKNVRFPLRDLLRNKESLLNAVYDTKSFIGPLSSGQHTKIKLLSRLYWCLAGSGSFIRKYGKDLEEFCRRVSEYEDSCRNRLGEKDTGVLFFDEGDLCYHPEWQRSYLSDVVGMSSALRKEDVQIIVTTNSPFILSDILREDVFYPLGNETSDGPGWEILPQTYGQNIHMLLAYPFFMKNTMGEMSEDTLIWFFNLFSGHTTGQNKEEREAVYTEVKSRFKDYFEERSRTGNVFAKDKYENIKSFLEKLADSIGERTYRVALRDKQERFFFEKQNGG